MKKVTVLGTSE